MENEGDTSVIGKVSEGGGADSTQAEGKTEEETGDESDAIGQEFLRVNENGGKRRSEDRADDDGERGAPKEVRVGQKQREGRGTEDRDPNDGFASDAVADRTADNRARGDGGEKEKEEELGVLNRDLKCLDEVERVIAPEAGEVEVFGENQNDENCDGRGHAAG